MVYLWKQQQATPSAQVAQSAISRTMYGHPDQQARSFHLMEEAESQLPPIDVFDEESLRRNKEFDLQCLSTQLLYPAIHFGTLYAIYGLRIVTCSYMET
ncbi:hypothetical protein M514_00489 [Trichuris suis]|uniref:Uncharacterized protein n=1 Tax=Trichuris suis TaxID=68888 RepID=A0A085MNK0_9BILA|nr:hypothetical protein M513_00489 [Trichuris suis]KFD72081.1 hypothetical protein M514_00489 [Trichuris suis]